MKSKLMILALALSFPPLLTGCTGPYQNSNAMPTSIESYAPSYWGGRVPASMPVEGEVEGLPTYGIPFQLPGSPTWISSFVITEDPGFFRDSDTFSEGGLAGSGAAQADLRRPAEFKSVEVRWHDAVFSNGEGTKSWSLLNRRGYISNWWLLLDSSRGEPTSRLSVFAAVINDTNDDGYLDNLDAAVAIITDADGRHAQVATPAHMQLTAVHYMPGPQLLGFEVREDKDGDGEFRSDEPIHYYFMDPFTDSAQTMPWHPGDFQEELESRYR